MRKGYLLPVLFRGLPVKSACCCSGMYRMSVDASPLLARAFTPPLPPPINHSKPAALLHLFGYLGPRDAPITTVVSKLWLHLYLQSRPDYARPPDASPIVRVQEEEEVGEVVEGEK